VLKEKIKRIKLRLKAWNKDQFEDTQKMLRSIEMELNKLKMEGDERQLNDQELKLQKQVQEDLWVAVHSHESLLI